MKNQDISSPVSVIGISPQMYRLNHQPNIAEILLKVALNTINLNHQNKNSYDIVAVILALPLDIYTQERNFIR
jgi:hypothetical protein